MDALIEKFGLAAHPEGGFYREIYRSGLTVRSETAADTRAAATHIYFLLGKGQVSRFHRVAHDEIWHHYQGDPLTLLLFDGHTLTTRVIGPGAEHYAAVVPAQVWQAAATTGEYSFMGCTVAPGFDFRDFSFLGDCPKDLALFREKAKGFTDYL